jgi:hypothetical protein
VVNAGWIANSSSAPPCGVDDGRMDGGRGVMIEVMHPDSVPVVAS